LTLRSIYVLDDRRSRSFPATAETDDGGFAILRSPPRRFADASARQRQSKTSYRPAAPRTDEHAIMRAD